MAIVALSQQSFLITKTLNSTQRPRHKNLNLISLKPISCRSSFNFNNNEDHHHSPIKKDVQLVKLAMVALAAGVLTLVGSVEGASAAKTGGRIGGQAFRPSAPRSSSPRINNSRTNIYINPPVAPPLIGGYGYGVPFYGGWGWSPFSFFAPGPSVAIGVGGGFEIFALFLFLGAAAAVVRRFTGSRDYEDDDY